MVVEVEVDKSCSRRFLNFYLCFRHYTPLRPQPMFTNQYCVAERLCLYIWFGMKVSISFIILCIIIIDEMLSSSRSGNWSKSRSITKSSSIFNIYCQEFKRTWSETIIKQTTPPHHHQKTF